MRYIFILLALFSLTAYADDTKSINLLFANYIDSLNKRDLTKLVSLMDENFLEKTGGKKHWKEVLSGPPETHTKDDIEIKKHKDLFFCRFVKKGEEVSDIWFVVIKQKDTFLFHDLSPDFDPKEKQN